MPDPEADPMKTAPTSTTKNEIIRLPTETVMFCIVSALDVIMTYGLLVRDDMNFVESNPFAGYFLDRWGIEGMVYFKGVMTLVACGIAQIVARKELALARQLLAIMTLIILGVVIYSVWLQFRH